jgi:outer membrane protein assembly factor BamA
MNYMNMYNSEGRLIGELDPEVVGADRLYLGPGIHLHANSRELSLFPRSGTYLFGGVHTWFATSPGRPPFHQLAADFRWYGQVIRSSDLVLALRLNGMATFGEVPFYQMARLGGRRSLRGYEFERFRGDHMIALSSEARFPLFREVIVIPVEFGGFVMADGGRLWYEGDAPGGWRGTWGAGVWGATLSRDVLGILYLAFSREGAILRAGFGFDY